MKPIQSTAPSGSPLEPFKQSRHMHFADMLANDRFLLKKSEQRNIIYLIIIAICVVATVLVATTFNYKTYVVRVDNATGSIETGGELKTTNYEPREAEIQHFLVKYIDNIRSVPLDPIVLKGQWNEAEHYMTKDALNKLNAFMAKDNPISKLGKQTVQTKVISMQLYPGSENTYQVRWTEKQFGLNGTQDSKTIQYVGLFLVIIDPPNNEQEMLINPLGIKVRDLTITKEK